MRKKGVDIWRIDSTDTVDLRMSREVYKASLEAMPNCRLLAHSVEDLVQEAEQTIFSPRANIWEEIVTEEVDNGTASYTSWNRLYPLSTTFVFLPRLKPNRTSKPRAPSCE